MNIIWLTSEIPYPPYGGRSGMFHRIEQISRYHRIYLFSIAYSQEEKETEGDMRKYCEEVHYYNRNESVAKKLLKTLALPYTVASRTIRALSKDIEALLDRVKIDVAIVDFPNMALNARGLARHGIPITVHQHNTEYRRMHELSKVKTISVAKRLAYYQESIRLELYEAWLYRSGMVKTITFVSEDDMAFFRKRWPRCTADLQMVPVGADKMECAPVPGKRRLMFVGRLDEVAVPNIEAILWFHREVLPRVISAVPDVHLIIAGANPSERVLSLASEHIEIIPNYRRVEDVYSLADCAVLPILSGGGVKGKLLEAAALKRIIVTTSKGIEGTKFRPQEHVLLADDAEGFAQACIRALTDPESCAGMVEAAYALFEKYYDWETIGAEYSRYLEGMVE